MRYYLDTNTIIYAVNGKYPSILDRIRILPTQSIIIPTVVLAELEYGARRSNSYERAMEIHKKFISQFGKADFNTLASNHYGIIRHQLESKGTIIGPNDLMIAATVMADKEGILITHNTKEFLRVPGLKVEDWTEE